MFTAEKPLGGVYHEGVEILDAVMLYCMTQEYIIENSIWSREIIVPTSWREQQAKGKGGEGHLEKPTGIHGKLGLHPG